MSCSKSQILTAMSVVLAIGVAATAISRKPASAQNGGNRTGGHGGHGPGQFFHLHSIATDSKGNIYIGESFGKRVARWKLLGM
jgi:hypothetical protein